MPDARWYEQMYGGRDEKLLALDQASAFNAGIPECQGEIIAFLDGDDWWAPGKLRAVAEGACQ
jgi:hypothetical protein